MRQVKQQDLFDVEAVTAQNMEIVAQKEKVCRDQFYSEVELPYFETLLNLWELDLQ